jgi:2-keto-4-pentenoate hydratase/2-oxohepta-3-ene-1,7-dioic acid hydratase in catechol pathway
MRLIRLGPKGRERAHVLTPDNRAVDVADITGDVDASFFARGGLEKVRRLKTHLRPSVDPGRRMRLGPPVAQVGKIVCVGLNYREHVAEAQAPFPTEPVVFLKASNTLTGPNDDVRIPRGSVKTDYEVELAVVVGRTCRYLESAAEGLASIAGYMVSNDVSEREYQLERGGQWTKGKSCETFNPAGPWLVTPDEIGDPSSLELWLTVNGERRQTGNTADMIFGVGEIVRYLSQFMVLEPGDIINTGTPPGVGLGRTPPAYLKSGDIVELGISGLGAQRQRFVAAP